MSLTKVNYINNSTIITAENLNEIQDNIIQNTNLIKKIAPRNFLDNSDFSNPVNQRGEVNYVPSTTTYWLDRWLCYGSGTTFTSGNKKLMISNDGSATCGLFQVISSNILTANKIYTLAFKATITGNNWCLSYGTNRTNSVGNSSALESDIEKIHIFTFTLPESLTDVYNFKIRSRTEVAGAATIEWAALYEGEYTAETLPEYQSKGYGAELTECQRYYFKYLRTSDIYSVGFGIARQTTGINFFLSIPTTMRVSPTISFTSPVYAHSGSGDKLEITKFTNYGLANNGIWLFATVSGATVGTVYLLRVESGQIELSADL